MSSTYSLLKWRTWRWTKAASASHPKTTHSRTLRELMRTLSFPVGRTQSLLARRPIRDSDEASDRALAAAENEGWPLATTRRKYFRAARLRRLLGNDWSNPSNVRP